MKRRARHWLGLLLALPAMLQAQAGAELTEQLLTAAQRDNASLVMTLMLRGTDPNLRNAERQTALHLALRHESDTTFQTLLKHPGLDVNAINQAGETPLMLAALKGRLDWMKALVARGALVNEPGWTALHYACSGPDRGAVRWLLEQGAAIDARSANGSTPLMMAAGYGDSSSVEVLLKAGADAGLRNEQGMDAADFARRAGRERLAEQLARARKP
ncbi:ankyrin repeat domain-containing protein [Paucibacter soli]|uniref:ankyrin repeat domain-containing protein n=1 Tax=Paucibacter soli TaxID=3133433 RepID=UPI0030A56100